MIITNGKNLLKKSKLLIFVTISLCLLINTSFALEESRSIIKLPYLRPNNSELTGRGITIAVIDTGINNTHPDFQGKTLTWNDVLAGSTTPHDDNGHGTHIASVATGTGAASLGRYKGVAPGANLIIEKACGSNGECYMGDVATAIIDATNRNANIIVMSITGTPNPSAAECRCDAGINQEKNDVCNAIKDALNNNIAVVASVGNHGNSPTTIEFPACINGVIAVGADHKIGYANDFYPYFMDFAPIDNIDLIHGTAEIHSIITITSDSPPQVFDNVWNGTFDPRLNITGFQRILTPNGWPAIVNVKVETKHKQRDCLNTEKIWWDPGSAEKDDEFWTWEKTFNYDASKPYILVEISEKTEFEYAYCPFEFVGQWKTWYNDYTCSGTALSCDSLDDNPYKCKWQSGCSWCGCRVGGLISSCVDIPQVLCVSPPPGVPGGIWTACEGTAKSCSSRNQKNGDLCGNPSTTGCTSSWNKDKDVYVKIEGAKSWEGIPILISGRGPPIQDPSLIKPLVTAPGMRVCAARAFKDQGNGAVQDCDIDDYVSNYGTSESASMVGGLIALIKEAKPTATNNEIVEALKHSDERIFSPYPNMEEGYGLINAQKSVDYTTNCQLRNKGYNDIYQPYCLNYDYNSYSSGSQMRNYLWSETDGDCGCSVNFDSYLTSISVNGVSSGDTSVLNNSIIIVDVDVKNTGTNKQGWWFVGVEFWNVTNYNDPWYTRDYRGRINAFYNGKDGTNGCDPNPDPVEAPEGGQCPVGVGCSILSESVYTDGKLDVDETIRVRCSAPASFYPHTKNNERIMFWVHERDLGQDATNNGDSDGDGNIGDWWTDALARSFRQGIDDTFGGPADVRVKINCRIGVEDSDNGQNYLRSGICTSYYQESDICKNAKYADACIDSNTLKEYFVSGSACDSVNKDCRDYGTNYTCSGGRCYKPSTGGGGGCLIEGTNILTPDGLKKIEDIQVGDTVIGYQDNKKTEAKVLGKSMHFGFWTIYYYKGSWFTDQHRVYASPDEEAVSVVTVSNKTGTYTGYVYNIETETMNYFGENGLLIHNRKTLCSEGACT